MVEVATVDQLCELISTLAVRGAPALGAAGAMGVALASVNGEPLDEAASKLIATRPTAVNLSWGVKRALAAADPVREAQDIAAADERTNRALSALGATLIADGASVLTHCNAGALACVGYGTAIGVIRAASEAGRSVHVWVDETRPLLQGARLTAWELEQLEIPFTLVIDSLAASLMARGRVDLVIVGADRVAANGDVANKVGTYGLAVLAHHHQTPFHIAAPLSTVDLGTRVGDDIIIEKRAPNEVTQIAGHQIAPVGANVENLAFDVTPAELVTSWITEAGIFEDARDLRSACEVAPLT